VFLSCLLRLRYSQGAAEAVTFSREARERFLQFACGRDAVWAGNFRDFNAAVRRMATLASGGRITREGVDEETERLRDAWRRDDGAKWI
jgi:transcriptional regulatory protein RtcR